MIIYELVIFACECDVRVPDFKYTSTSFFFSLLSVEKIKKWHIRSSLFEV